MGIKMGIWESRHVMSDTLVHSCMDNIEETDHALLKLLLKGIHRGIYVASGNDL